MKYEDKKSAFIIAKDFCFALNSKVSDTHESYTLLC